MASIPRGCLDCGVPTIGSRCKACRAKRQRARDAQRGTRAERGYGYQYQQARKQLLASNPLCHWCGTRPATTADHEPPLHIDPNSTTLVPACAPCNYGRTHA